MNIHTFISGLLDAKDLDINDVIVLLPTPPLPDSTNNLFLTVESFLLIRSAVRSGCWLIPDAHIIWFGQFVHIDAFPASLLAVPGQSIKILLFVLIKYYYLFYNWDIHNLKYTQLIHLISVKIIIIIIIIII